MAWLAARNQFWIDPKLNSPFSFDREGNLAGESHVFSIGQSERSPKLAAGQ